MITYLKLVVNIINTRFHHKRVVSSTQEIE